MSENTTDKVEWLYGLEEYFLFTNKEPFAKHIHDFISLNYVDDPTTILKKLILKSQTLPADIFSKHLNCYFNSGKKEFNLVEIASTLKDVTNDKLLNIIHAFARNNLDINQLGDAFSKGQVRSKIWLIKELSNVSTRYNNVMVLAGWYGQLKLFYDRLLTYHKMRIVDLDRTACEASDYIFNLSNLENYKVKSVCADINNLTCYKTGYEWDVTNFKEGTSYKEKFLPDLIINTSAEHMTEEWFNQIRFKEFESNPIVAIQSNNMFNLPEHVNCVHSVNHMKKKFPMKEILFEGELQLKGYKRVMLIGRP